MMVLLALSALVAAQAAAGPALLAAEAMKVDLARRQLIVRAGDPLREIAFDVDEARTRLSSGGRPIALERVRPGDWVLVAYEEAGTRRLAVLVKVGAARPAAGPRRSPSS